MLGEELSEGGGGGGGVGSGSVAGETEAVLGVDGGADDSLERTISPPILVGKEDLDGVAPGAATGGWTSGGGVDVNFDYS